MILMRKLRSARALAFHDRPIYTHVGVTHRCNMRCRMCSIPERANVSAEGSPEKFAIAAKEIARLGCMAVSLGGGEPFLRKDLPKIVEAFAGRGMRVRVLTNGATATEQMVADVANAGAADISISLDSLDESVQTALENRKGLLEKKYACISNVQKHFPRDSVHILNAVVTPQTLPGLVDVARFAKALGFFAGFIPVHIEAGHHFFTGETSFRFRDADRRRVRAVYGELMDLRAKGGIVNSRKFLENSMKYLLGEPVSWNCNAGSLYLSIGPDARIAACHEFEDTRSVEPEEFAERFMRGAWGRETAKLRAGCRACFRPCWAEVDFLASNPGAFFSSLKMRFMGSGQSAPKLDADEIAALADRMKSESEASS